MSQRAGELCHRVTIQKHEVVFDEYNYKTEQWIDYLTLWAKVTAQSVRDVIAAQSNQHQTIARCKLRKRKDIDSTMRLVHDGRMYAIDGPPLDDPENGKIYMTLMLSEGVEKFPDV